MRKKRTTKRLVKFAATYGFHVWVIFFLANFLLFYSFNFFSRAQEQPTSENEFTLRADPLPTDAGPTPTHSPDVANPVLDLAFSIPGIGSGSGNMAPKHPKRKITVYLYAPDVSANNTKSVPLYVIESTVVYDTNTLSPTYTSFINHSIDLGADVKPGKYQITFKTEQSFRTLIKEFPEDVGGKLFTVMKDGEPLDPGALQSVAMGDIAPLEGNNVMAVDDFNVFLGCFGSKQTEELCAGKYIADLNDDGEVNGLDYNLMVLSFQRLIKQGYPPVLITVPPVLPTTVSKLSELSPTPKKQHPTPTPAPVKETSSSSGGAAFGAIIFIVFMLIVGAIGFILYKTNPKVHGIVSGLLHKSPAASEAQQNTAGPAEQSTPAQQSAEVNPSPAAATNTSQATSTAEDPNAPKEYFVKKESDDPNGGVWLSLTGDSGALSAHYSGKDVKDGFAKVKGEMKTENGKTFLEISELTAE